MKDIAIVLGIRPDVIRASKILKLLNRKPFSLNAIANNPQNDTNCDLC